MTPPKASRADGKRMIDQAFQDRISWTAARVLLERVQAEGAPLSDDLRAAIARFLARHPEI